MVSAFIKTIYFIRGKKGMIEVPKIHIFTLRMEQVGIPVYSYILLLVYLCIIHVQNKGTSWYPCL